MISGFCPRVLCPPPPPLVLMSAGWTLMECCSAPSFVSCFAFPASSTSMSLALLLLLPPPLCLSTSGLTPALACAPSREVADCLALILATMMPFCSPCSSGAPSPGSLLRQLPHQGGKGPGPGPRGPRSPRNPSGPSSEGTTENDSEDSETFWHLRTGSLPSYLDVCTWTLHPPRGAMQCPVCKVHFEAEGQLWS